ncbi:hypothetical protein NS303_21615 [Pantoea ananatis]|uniref:DUF3592 domain-containing protein n=1 Tax=Pantoea ananas TaxID=553 RepID=UPI000736CDC2|nr:DUF3592 domain-containing protein [Pantoea ananatis]KTR45716.1 hypothetical protein NS303_21615 [Pantoea ananatis]KTR51307.1 hypothetical protein NS311_21490 [Pantoea ananatis]KTR62493.1 hypothetical protein RSA47_21045 [Pantoea ananatis]KTR69077.1 hypothetical protein NS296_16390 [Pantoea ananatis]MDS7721866.1 DUF3592 domain-containing protein [Pantoea ananatis]
MSASEKGWAIFAAAVSVFVLFRMVNVFTRIFLPLIKNGFVQANIIKTGIAANADIISTQQTTVWSGGQPVYTICVKFRTLENKQIEASIMRNLTLEEIERFKPGNGTIIKYDPKNPKRIALYDKPLILER